MWDEVNVAEPISMLEGGLNSNHEEFGLNSFLYIFDVEWQLKGADRVVVAYNTQQHHGWSRKAHQDNVCKGPNYKC